MSREAFEAWWEKEGQFLRAGGGDYEKTFAFHAWQAAQADAYERAAKVCETAEVPIAIDMWMGTKKTLTVATAIRLAGAIRALAKGLT